MKRCKSCLYLLEEKHLNEHGFCYYCSEKHFKINQYKDKNCCLCEDCARENARVMMPSFELRNDGLTFNEYIDLPQNKKKIQDLHDYTIRKQKYDDERFCESINSQKLTKAEKMSRINNYMIYGI